MKTRKSKESLLTKLSQEYEQVSLHTANISKLLCQLADEQITVISTNAFPNINLTNIDEKFYDKFVDVYADAEKIRINRNNSRKASRQVNVALNTYAIDLLTQDFGEKFAFERDGRYIIVKLNEAPYSLLRISPDLGFQRGLQWRKLLEMDVKKAHTLGVDLSRLFILTLSCINSFSQKDIDSRLTKEDTLHKADLLTPAQRGKLDTYLAKYKRSFDDIAPGLSQQLFFESASNHPNIDGTARYNNSSLNLDDVIYERGFKAFYQLLINA